MKEVTEITVQQSEGAEGDDESKDVGEIVGVHHLMADVESPCRGQTSD
jgi:hypothetical protein